MGHGDGLQDGCVCLNKNRFGGGTQLQTQLINLHINIRHSLLLEEPITHTPQHGCSGLHGPGLLLYQVTHHEYPLIIHLYWREKLRRFRRRTSRWCVGWAFPFVGCLWAGRRRWKLLATHLEVILAGGGAWLPILHLGCSVEVVSSQFRSLCCWTPIPPKVLNVCPITLAHTLVAQPAHSKFSKPYLPSSPYQCPAASSHTACPEHTNKTPTPILFPSSA